MGANGKSISNQKKLVVFILLILFSAISANSQISYEVISKNLNEIASIDPTTTEYSGYQTIAEQIGKARIVMLGEQTHGHGTTFTAKIKIIKYLVENLGFDVIAFESSFYEIDKIWNSSEGLSKKLDSTKREIYGIWSKPLETAPLFDYIIERNSKGLNLDIAGFDCQHEMPYGRKNYVNDLTSFITNNSLKIRDDIKYQKFISLLKRLIAFDTKSETSINEINLFNEVIDSVQSKLSGIKESYDAKLWSQELRSLKKEARSVWNPSNLKGMSKFAARDSAMAENLVWLVNNKFKGRKVIVWAASFHIAKGNKHFIKTKHFDPAKIVTMGNVVNSLLPDQVYNIGFVSSEGQYSEWYAKDSPNYAIKRSASSFEQFLAKTQYDFAFVKMREIINDKPFNMAGIDYFENSAVWNKIFDGIFYIRVMRSPTYMKK